MDKRNTYRIRKTWSHVFGEYVWAAEYRPWYWLFYFTIAFRDSRETAISACNGHAARWLLAKTAQGATENLGRLP